MNLKSQINNEIYDDYGERWYSAHDDPIALLRAENRLKLPWIYERIKNRCKTFDPIVLDVGCGAGFLCNGLAEKGLRVEGIDQSLESLRVAKLYDKTSSVKYQIADAYDLPFENASLDVITCLDFLEHVSEPRLVIQECARVLRPDGLFFFHTFNRNFLSWLLIIKAVEMFVKNTPKDMHVIELFIKPSELEGYCSEVGLNVEEMIGMKPKFSSIPFKNYFSGVVPEEMEFELTDSLKLSYMGMARLQNNWTLS